jgi:hypothetical protein
LTVDEELNLLDDALRRLKVEYDVYFGGGTKKPPQESEWRVQSLMKRYADTQKLTFEQRFKYNTIAQRYAIMSDLWRQKLRIREEGYRRPQDALLSIQGLRTDEEHAAEAALNPKKKRAGQSEPFAIECSDPEAERENVRSLFEALVSAKQATGETAPAGTFESFLAFVNRKTLQIRETSKCDAVEYSVHVEQGRVALKARAKT